MLAFWSPDTLPYAIDWGAWATLATGMAAVVGAVIIGLRQVGIAAQQVAIAERQAAIMERQTEIAVSQAETERTRLQSELYDRRLDVFAGIEQFLVEAGTNDGAVTNSTRDGLFKSLSVARHILGEDVEKIGREIHTTAVLLQRNATRLARIDQADVDARTNLSDEIDRRHDRLINLYEQLRGTMEHYLRWAGSPTPKTS